MSTPISPRSCTSLACPSCTRVFPSAQVAPKAVHQDAQTDALVAELHAQLAQMRERLDDTIKQRDAWQGIAERLALGAPKPPEPQPMTWWRWLRSTE